MSGWAGFWMMIGFVLLGSIIGSSLDEVAKAIKDIASRLRQ